MIKSINQAVVFIMELVMVYAFGYIGYKTGSDTFSKYALAILLTAICIFLWGIFAAPKSTRRLSMPYLGLFRCSMFLTASLFLFLSDHKTISIVMAVLALVTQVASFYIEME